MEMNTHFNLGNLKASTPPAGKRLRMEADSDEAVGGKPLQKVQLCPPFCSKTGRLSAAEQQLCPPVWIVITTQHSAKPTMHKFSTQPEYFQFTPLTFASH